MEVVVVVEAGISLVLGKQKLLAVVAVKITFAECSVEAFAESVEDYIAVGRGN